MPHLQIFQAGQIFQAREVFSGAIPLSSVVARTEAPEPDAPALGTTEQRRVAFRIAS
jgi:hypothetical protein